MCQHLKPLVVVSSSLLFPCCHPPLLSCCCYYKLCSWIVPKNFVSMKWQKDHTYGQGAINNIDSSWAFLFPGGGDVGGKMVQGVVVDSLSIGGEKCGSGCSLLVFRSPVFCIWYLNNGWTEFFLYERGPPIIFHFLSTLKIRKYLDNGCPICFHFREDPSAFCNISLPYLFEIFGIFPEFIIKVFKIKKTEKDWNLTGPWNTIYYGAQNLVTATSVQWNYHHQNTFFFLSLW